jgi:hypothetical protein
MQRRCSNVIAAIARSVDSALQQLQQLLQLQKLPAKQ